MLKLSLVSGSPVSFIQNLQKPLYRYRPVVPIPDDLNLDPQIHDTEGGVGHGTGDGYGSGSGAGGGSNSASVNNRQIQGLTAQSNVMVVDGVTTDLSNALINEESGVKTAATGNELGDLFEYRIENAVTVPRNRSALIPIIQTKMEGERISIYNEETRKQRPMGGMLLTNVTPLTFEGGSLTVLDRDAYAGEALMERLKPKEKRLISFALDLGTNVHTEHKEDREPAKLLKVVNGVFQAHYFRTDEKIYHITNQTDRKKVVYVEHPVRYGWILSDKTSRPDITTERYYRFRVELEPFQRQDLTVAESQGLMDSYQLSTLTRDQLNLFLTRRYIDEETKAKFEKLINIRLSIGEVDRKLASFNDEVEKIEEDQKRLRQNIETLAKTPEAKTLIARYIAKAGEQETRLEEMEKERKTLAVEKQRLESELGGQIRGFTIAE